MPSKSALARALRRYRVHEAGMLREPSSPAARARFQDSAYTLCILMGRRTALEAVRAAERYLADGATGRPKHQQHSGQPEIPVR
ncbi:DUF5133 domain-containing protein [Streptomyces sp. NPDC015127]|uniref:DUF5133 domain-containing protein n=1 Tax=Streptomyces sp. NPDC015127 TaxID=3364939 RepID=UPI0036F889B1